MPEEQTEQLHFRISGPWLVGLVRARVLEDAWESGMRILLEAFGDDFAGHALEILQGAKTLKGVDELTLEDEDPEVQAEYLEEVERLYAPRFRWGDRWYKPYTVVEGGGTEDAKWVLHGWAQCHCQRAYAKTGPAGGNSKGWIYALRPLYYANDPAVDIIVRDSISWPSSGYGGTAQVFYAQAILAQPCKNIPIWMPVQDSAEAAVAAYVKHWGYSLERRGPEPRARDLVDSLAAHALAVDLLLEHDRKGASPEIDLNPSPEELAAEEEALQIHHRVHSTAPATDEQVYQASLSFYRNEIKDRLHSLEDWIELKNREGVEVAMVPRAPFVNWCLWRTAGAHLAPPWPTVCPPGFKMTGDDPFHTDWLVGGGLDPRFAYKDELNQAAHNTRARIMEEMLGFKCAVLSGRGYAIGPVVLPEEDQECPPGSIAVLPNARPGYEAAVRTAAAVVVPVGGELCHLAQVATEAGRKIVRVPDCMALFRKGARLVVDCDRGICEIAHDDVNGPFAGLCAGLE